MGNEKHEAFLREIRKNILKSEAETDTVSAATDNNTCGDLPPLPNSDDWVSDYNFDVQADLQRRFDELFGLFDDDTSGQ